MRTKHLVPVLAVAASLGLALPAGAASAPQPGCSTRWGSLEKTDAGQTQSRITNLRPGRHTCFDRLVIDLDGPVDGYGVRYVSTFTDDGSGAAVPLRGAADLAVTVHAPAHDADYVPTYSPASRTDSVSVSGFRTFRQVAFRGTFEGVTTIGLGVRARLPMRVTVLPGPGAGSRLVIDVAHSW